MAQHRTRESKLKPRRPNIKIFENKNKHKETTVLGGSRALGEAPKEAKMAQSRPEVGLR